MQSRLMVDPVNDGAGCLIFIAIILSSLFCAGASSLVGAGEPPVSSSGGSPKTAVTPAQAPPPAVDFVIPRVPSAAAALALLDLQAQPPEVRIQRRYIWCPEGSTVEWQNAIFTLNSAPNLSSLDVAPPSVFKGALIPVDLSTFIDESNQLSERLATWNSQADIEPYFTQHPVLPCAEYTAIDGKKYNYRQFHLIGQSLGEAGPKLEKLMGNDFADRESFCPIVRVDWFLSRALTPVDGGFYYRWRKLTVGKTKLDDYLLSRGVPRKDIESRNAPDCEICMSKITGRARKLEFLVSSAVKASASRGTIALTFDSRADRVDPRQDAFLSLLDVAPDALEVMVTLPNGWIEYTLWDDKELLLAEADPRVVTDSQVPSPYQNRLVSGISCIRCHGSDEGWRPFANEFKALIGDRGRVLTDTSKGTDADEQFNQWRKTMSQFSGDLLPVVRAAQDDYEFHIHHVLHTTAKLATANVSEMFASYNYTPITAYIASNDLGFKPGKLDKLGVDTFRNVVPPIDYSGLAPDHGFIARLSCVYIDPITAEPKGLTLTRLQWELIYEDTALRSYAALANAKKDK